MQFESLRRPGFSNQSLRL